MVFSSFVFLFRFLPVFLLVYYLTPSKYKNAALFLGSIAFYTIGEAEYVFLLLQSVLVNYLLGRLLFRAKKEETGGGQKALLVLALVYDFGVLFYFKYSGSAVGLPLGISFYTFQIAAYMIDVFRGAVPAEESFVRLGTYLTMFPQLIAGPIVNYSEVRWRLLKRSVQPEQFEDGMKTLIIGLGAKVIVADRIGMLWNQIQTIGFNSISTPLAWMGVFAYSIELYFDFAGYSMMAIGLGKMLGFEIPVNFCHPYISKSVSEFWRRWHMTLGRWFLEYVYIPLGGNRLGSGRTFFNLFVVWSLTALWHGSGTNYLIWGASLLILLALEKLFLLPYLERGRWLGHLYLLFVVPLSWMAFAITDVEQLGVYVTRLFSLPGSGGVEFNQFDYMNLMKDYWGLFLLGILFSTPLPLRVYQACKDTWIGSLAVMAILVLGMYYLAVSVNNPFLYFNF